MKRAVRILSTLLAMLMLISVVTTSVCATTLKKGSSGKQVKYLQMNLNGLGYSCGSTDGKYGAKTVQAVKAFQKAYDLDVDGIAGDKTQGEICSIIKDLQQKLYDLGYAVGDIDGVFGSKTIAAVKKFQKDNSISANGIANSKTIKAINEKHNAINQCPLNGSYIPFIDVPSYETSIKTEIVSVEYIKDVYSDWKALNSAFYARRNGQSSEFEKSEKITVTSSLNLTADLKLVEAKLGVTVEKSVTSTILGTNSGPLAKGEYCRFYYREHWKRYEVVEETTITQFGRSYSYTSTKIIDVAQELTADDYGWFYATKSKYLPDTLDSKYCDDNYVCIVN